MSHVLLVEDNTVLLENIALDLEMRGYQVTKAVDGSWALDYLETNFVVPDIIISDISMPETDGFTLLERLQNNPLWVDIPFIFLTALASEENIRLGKRLGADDYLIKPFNADDLTIAIENKLRRASRWKNRDRQPQLEQTGRELTAIIQSQQNSLWKFMDAYGGDSLLEDLEAMPDEFSQRATDVLRTSAYQTNRLINQIVLLAKLDRSQTGNILQNQKVPVNLCLMVETACQLLAQEFNKSTPLFQLKYASQELYVKGIWDLFILSIGEVVRNALLFSQETVEIRVLTENDAGIVQVIDKGIGIDRNHLPLIWDRFSQFCITGNPQQGPGLGLAIVSEMICLVDGRIQIESKPRLGTTVTLYFPLAYAGN